MSFDAGTCSTYFRVERDVLIQGGVVWDATVAGHEVIFPVVNPHGADAISIKSLSGARVWATKAPGDRTMTVRAVVHSDPPGPVAWESHGRKG